MTQIYLKMKANHNAKKWNENGELGVYDPNIPKNESKSQRTKSSN